MGVWCPVPGSPIYGQIRVALPPEAVEKIHRVSGNDNTYELTLEDVELIDVPPRRGPGISQ